MSIYKYVTSEVAAKILDGNIRFTQPNAFNDPFEMLPDVVLPSLSEEKEIGFNLTFNLIAPRRPEYKKKRNKTDKKLNSNDELARDIRKQFSTDLGMLCLTKNSESLTMWGHYADEYRGAIIEFNEKHEFFKGLLKVEYVKKRPKRDLGYFNSGTPIPIAEMCFKSTQWRYEKEVRIVRPLDQCQQVAIHNTQPVFVGDVPLDAIISVTMGERMPIQHQKFFYSKLRETNIGLTLAAVDHNSFGFRYDVIKGELPSSKFGAMITPRTAHIFDDFPGDLGEAARWMLQNHNLSKMVNKTV